MNSKLRFLKSVLVIVLFSVHYLKPNQAEAKLSRPIRSSKLKTKKEVLPLQEQASLEIKKIPAKGNQRGKRPQLEDSDLQPQNGIFYVDRPKLILSERRWKYLLGMKIQLLQPLGFVRSEIVGDFYLNNYPARWMPSLEFGGIHSLPSALPWTHWSYVGAVGYSSAKVHVQFPSGYPAPEDTRLNLMLASLKAEVLRPLPPAVPGLLKVGIGLGKIFYTQTSPNDLAQFSENLMYGSLNLGCTYLLSDAIQVLGTYTLHYPLHSSTMGLQRHNFELGAEIKW